MGQTPRSTERISCSMSKHKCDLRKCNRTKVQQTVEAVHRHQGEFAVTEVDECVVSHLLHTLYDGRTGARRHRGRLVGYGVCEEASQRVLRRGQHQVAHVQNLHLSTNIHTTPFCRFC